MSGRTPEALARAAKVTAGPYRVHVPFFVEDGRISTDPVEQHPYPPPRAVECEYWNARSRDGYRR